MCRVLLTSLLLACGEPPPPATPATTRAGAPDAARPQQVDAARPQQADAAPAPAAVTGFGPERTAALPVASAAWDLPKDAVDEALTPADLARADALLEDALRAREKQGGAWALAHIDRYRRQVIGFRAAGRRQIYLNYFCSSHGDWTKGIVSVDDGGPCYFQAVFDLEAGAYTRLQFNGVG